MWLWFIGQLHSYQPKASYIPRFLWRKSHVWFCTLLSFSIDFFFFKGLFGIRLFCWNWKFFAENFDLLTNYVHINPRLVTSQGYCEENHTCDFAHGLAFLLIFFLKVCLGSVYFAETENFLLKVLKIKVKVSWNNTMRPMNSTKKCSGTHE